MGEYASYQGREIKIGTCENMYYLRADQARLVTAERGNVDPVTDADSIRFRFPFPDEDMLEPGEFEDYGRAIAIHGAALPLEVEHSIVQFVASAGYNVCLPCPEGPEASANPYTVHRNGFGGAVKLVQQAVRGGLLVAICECGGCGSKYRLPTLADAATILEPIADAVERALADENTSTAKWWLEIARRITDGYQPDAVERVLGARVAS